MVKRKTGWLIALACLSVAILLAGVAFYITSVQDALWMQSISDIREVTDQGAHSLDTYIESDQAMLHSVALRMGNLESTETDRIYSRLTISGREESHYFLADLTGMIFYSGLTETSRELTDEEYLSYTALEGAGVREPYHDIETGLLSLSYYERFTFADGHEGIVVKTEPLSVISDEYTLSFYNDTGFAYVMNQHGDILIRPSHKDSNRTFKNLYDVIDMEGNDDKELAAFRQANEEGKSGAALFLNNGEEYVYVYVTLESVPEWQMVSVIPNSVISQHTSKILRSSMIFIVILLAGCLALVSFFLMMRRSRRSILEKEQELRYQEQMFNILSNNTDQVFLMLDPKDNHVEYISPNVERVLGFTAADVRKDLRTLQKGYTPDGGETDGLEQLAALPLGGTYTQTGTRLHQKTGELRWFEETSYRATVEDTDKFIVVLSDRTAEKKSREALQEALEIAEQANASKSSFLSNMSHDIRTPMNAIVGLVTLLQKDADDPEKVREYTKKITTSSQYLLSLINDVLDISKIESGKTTLNISDFYVGDMVSELDLMIRPQAEARKETFTVTVSGVKHEHLLGDTLRLNQIFINILSNAVKYTQVGGNIEMTVEELPQQSTNFSRLRVVVRDNGQGMSKEYQEVIFQPFTREKNSTTNKIQGTGLGMAITGNLVKLMGGVIKVDSEVGQGSTFTVDLTLRIPEEEADPMFWVNNGITHALVVDDDEHICKNIMETMDGTGVNMAYALGGVPAVKMVEEAHQSGTDYDLILLDWQMPDMDGVETARHIRKIVPPETSILVLTAYDWADIEDEALDAGINAFLQKPFFLTSCKLAIEKLKADKSPDALPVPEPEGALDGLHILAAEDNEINAEILVELLDITGATCEVAEDGKLALEAFQSSEPGKYDLILMDVQMPVMNGYEATRAIRACEHPLAKTIPIIAMTANAFSEDIQDALDSGMDAHVAKPIDLTVLEKTVCEVLAKKKQQQTENG